MGTQSPNFVGQFMLPRLAYLRRSEAFCFRKEPTMTKPSSQNSDPAKRRNRSRLSMELEKNLSAYAIAAGSAGVALLACVQSAEAKIIFTKTDLFVPDHGSVQFDINNDGQMDFALSRISQGACSSTNTSARQKHGHRRGAHPPLGCGFFYDVLQIGPQQAANEVWVTKTSFGADCANAVRRGTAIGPARDFAAGVQPMSIHQGTSEGSYFCPWAFQHSPYLGVKFTDLEGNLHYGWVGVSVRKDYGTVIGEYAYETVPNKPIHAGSVSEDDDDAGLVTPSGALAPMSVEPATLGRLAQGAGGLAAWRREEEVVAA
jgi:hypothetical protein